MTCLDEALRAKVLDSPATLDPAAPDLILFEKNKHKYLAELKRLSKAWFLASNGFEVYPVNVFQALYYMLMGLFGKANPCDKQHVRHAVKKLLYFGYIQEYNENEAAQYFSARYISLEEQACFRKKKSPHHTEALQNTLLSSYEALQTPTQVQQDRVFGQNLVKSNLWDTLLELEPQHDSVLDALAGHYEAAPIAALSENSTIRNMLAKRFLEQGLWHLAISIQPDCLKGQEAATFALCLEKKHYLEAAQFFETYNGCIAFDTLLCKQLAEALYDQKQAKVRERDAKHAKALALTKNHNVSADDVRQSFAQARKAAEEVIVYAQRSDILSTDAAEVRDRGFAKSLATGHLRMAEILLNQIGYLPNDEKEQNLALIWSQLKMAQIPNEPLLTGYLEATERFFELLLSEQHRTITNTPNHASKQQLAIKLAHYLDELLCVDAKFHEHIQKNTAFFAKIYWISGELHSFFQLDPHKAYVHLSMAYSLAPTNLLYMFSVGREHEVPQSVFRKLLSHNIAKEARKQGRAIDDIDTYVHQFWRRDKAYGELQSWDKPTITALVRIRELLAEMQESLGGSLHTSFSMFQGSAGKLKSLVHSFLENTAIRGKIDAPREDVRHHPVARSGL